MENRTIEALREVLHDMTLAIELISSGERSGEALVHFIEEMLKTIEAWAVKYNVILDDGVLEMESAQISRPKPSPMSVPSSCPNYPTNDASKVEDHLEGLLILDQQLDVDDQVKERVQTEGDAHSRCAESLNQDREGNDERGKILVQLQNDENESNERQEANQCKAKPSQRASRKTRSQVATTSSAGGFMDMDGIFTDDGQVKVLEPLSESPKLTDATLLSETYQEGVKSPDWLPKGWVVQMKTRGTSVSASHKDKYYCDPTSKQLFQSKDEVLAFLGTTKRKRGRPKKSGSLAELAQMTDESPRHIDDAAEAESLRESMMGFNAELQLLSDRSSIENATSANSFIVETPTEAANSSIPTLDTIKRKRGRPRKVDSIKSLSEMRDQLLGHASAAGGASTVLESAKNSTSQLHVSADRSPPVATSATAASSGPVNSCIPMPHQAGQTSEWLVYESLASLPFPMFEHLRLVESTANKLAYNNSPPTLWPWMLGSAEGMKKSVVDNKPTVSKLVDENKQDQNAPISSTVELPGAESVPKRPKKAARKNAS